MANPPPFILRLYQPGDFNAVLAVIQAASQADRLPGRVTATELRARLSSPASEPGLEAGDDHWVVAVHDAGLVAYGDGWLVGEGPARSYRTECWVHPAYRGRGLGRALFKRQGQRARAISRRLSRPNEPVAVTLSARAWQRQTSAVALLEASGLQRVRTYVEMTRDLSALLPPLEVPAGLRLEPWLNHHDDEALWRAYDEAFADHWGHTPEPFEEFVRRITMGHVQRPHSFVAWAGGQVAGASLNDIAEEHAAAQAAQIHHLFVRRAWRGRRVGRALVAASLARAKALGYGAVALRVDEENPTGAVALYAGAGFAAGERRCFYQRVYEPANDAGRAG